MINPQFRRVLRHARLAAEGKSPFQTLIMVAGKVRSSSEAPVLFIPLKNEYFDAFDRGTKTEEYRPYGPRWNETSCFLGRRVLLSRGYGTHNRLTGTVSHFSVTHSLWFTPAWEACYPEKICLAACIGITLDHDQPTRRQ